MNRSRLLAGAVFAAGVLALSGCGPKEPPVTAEAVARIEAARREAAAAAAEARGTTRSDPEPRPAARSPSAAVEQVTLEPEGGVETPPTLAEASAAARQQRRETPQRASVVITNDNLSDFASQGQVTVANVPDAAGSASEDEAGVAGTVNDPSSRGEEYWRQRVRDVRMRWAEAAEEVVELEAEAAELRWAFYAEDDPYYRDQRIKPEWDRTLDDLRRARQDARSYRRELGDVLTEGRADGALPGWLREGIELEPEDALDVETVESGSEPQEPTIFDESGRERP